MTNIFAPDISRFTYERIVESAASQLGITPELFKQSYKVYPSQVVMGTNLNSGLNSYQLSPRKGVNPQIATEIKLDQNDFFGISGIGLRFARATYSSTSGVYSQHGNYPKLTYPDPVYFNGNPASGLDEWECLQTIVNGSLSILVTGDTLLDAISCEELVYKGTTGYNATGPVLPQIGGTDGQRGIFDITPQIILDASADNQIVVTLADGDKTVIDGSVNSSGAATAYRNLLWVVLYGWKIKNLAGAGVAACRV